MKFDIFFFNLWKTFKCASNRTRIRGTLHEHVCTFAIVCRYIFLRMRIVWDKNRRENQNTFLFTNFPPSSPKSCSLRKNMGGGGLQTRTGHRRLYNTTHAHCMSDNLDYIHAFRIRNIYCFTTATVITRMRLCVNVIRTSPDMFHERLSKCCVCCVAMYTICVPFGKWGRFVLCEVGNDFFYTT